jgi:hypothetical protein
MVIDGQWLSVGSPSWAHAAALPLLLPLQFQQFLNDIIGVDLQLVIEVVLHLRPQVIVSGGDLEVALRGMGVTWYFLMEQSLSLERSNNSSTRLFAIELVIISSVPLICKHLIKIKIDKFDCAYRIFASNTYRIK